MYGLSFLDHLYSPDATWRHIVWYCRDGDYLRFGMTGNLPTSGTESSVLPDMNANPFCAADCYTGVHDTQMASWETEPSILCDMNPSVLMTFRQGIISVLKLWFAFRWGTWLGQGGRPNWESVLRVQCSPGKFNWMIASLWTYASALIHIALFSKPYEPMHACIAL